jgi:hypothetical protein
LKFAEIFPQVKVHHRYQRHWWQICHWYRQYLRNWWQYLPPVLLVTAAISPRVSLIPVGKFAAGVNNTSGNLPINDTGGKFATGGK